MLIVSPGVPLTKIAPRSMDRKLCHSPAIQGTSEPSSPLKITGPALPGGQEMVTDPTSR